MRVEYVVSNGKVRLAIHAPMFHADPKFVKIELLGTGETWLHAAEIDELVAHLQELKEDL